MLFDRNDYTDSTNKLDKRFDYLIGLVKQHYDITTKRLRRIINVYMAKIRKQIKKTNKETSTSKQKREAKQKRSPK